LKTAEGALEYAAPMTPSGTYGRPTHPSNGRASRCFISKLCRLGTRETPAVSPPTDRKRGPWLALVDPRDWVPSVRCPSPPPEGTSSGPIRGPARQGRPPAGWKVGLRWLACR
jgi:hypothetical protein